MKPFNIDLLLLPTFTIFICLIILVFLSTKSPVLSIILSTTKAILFIFYFGFIFDGTYTFLDDWTYIERGGVFFSKDIHFLNFFRDWDYLKIVSVGEHFVYYLYNSSSFFLFGEYYFSPVALNIILTGIIAHIAITIVRREFFLDYKTYLFFYCFIFFHPSIIAWSQICNLKDILVLCLHTSMLNGISLISHKKNLTGLITILITSSILYFIRFYVPLIFVLTLLITIILTKAKKRAMMPIVIISVLLYLSQKYHGSSFFLNAADRININIIEFIYGFIRIIFTPIPFHTEDSYRFLNYPSLFNWIMFPSTLVGFFKLSKEKTFFCTFLCIYFLCFLSLYASYIDLQGPRHKVQLDFALCLFQFTGWHILFNSFSNTLIKKSL